MTARPAPRSGPRRRLRLGEDERRRQIIDATIAVVAREGFDGASANKIAAAAEVSKGLVFKYFGDLDGLFRQTVLTTGTVVRDEIAAELDLSQPVPDVIRAALRRVATLSQSHPDELHALNQITRSLRRPDGSPAFSSLDYEDNYRAQEALFGRGQREGTLRPFDVRVMAVSYQGAIDGMLGYLESHPETDPVAYADALADVLLGGVAMD